MARFKKIRSKNGVSEVYEGHSLLVQKQSKEETIEETALTHTKVDLFTRSQ